MFVTTTSMGAMSTIITLLLRLVTLLPGFERELRLLPSLVRRGDVCLDIGAALGVYSVALAAVVGRAGAVHAVEPRPNAVQRLRRLARWLGFGHVTVHDCAVGVGRGVADIIVPGRNRPIPGRSYLSLDALHHDHDDGLVERSRHRIDVLSVDELRRRIGRRVAFMKCDVEGFELAVLRGASHVLSADRPIVLCEVEDRHTARYGHRPDEVAALLRAHGYRHVALGRAGSDGGRNQLWIPHGPPAG